MAQQAKNPTAGFFDDLIDGALSAFNTRFQFKQQQALNELALAQANAQSLAALQNDAQRSADVTTNPSVGVSTETLLIGGAVLAGVLILAIALR